MQISGTSLVTLDKLLSSMEISTHQIISKKQNSLQQLDILFWFLSTNSHTNWLLWALNLKSDERTRDYSIHTKQEIVLTK